MKKYVGLVGMVAVLLLAGCGTAVEPSSAPPKPAVAVERSDAPAAIDAELAARKADREQKAARMITTTAAGTVLHHRYGDTLLPASPQRVAVIRMEDPMVALGVPMAAAHQSEGFYLNGYLQDHGVRNISINETTKTINLEEVQQVKPDLIVMRDSFDRRAYEALSKIAPVAVLNLQDSETSLLVLGRIFSMEARAEERLDEYYRRVKETRLAVKGRIGNAPVALVRILKNEVRLYPYSSNATNRFMYELLNLTPEPLAVIGDGNATNVVSPEQLPSLSAQWLLVSAGYGPSSRQNNEAAQRRYRQLQDDPLWRLIPAVRSGHVIEVDSRVWNAHGIIAKELAMAALRQAVEQRTATALRD